MIEIFLFAYTVFKIRQLADRKGKRVTPWVIIAILAFFAGYVIGGSILLIVFYKGPMQQDEMMQFLLNPFRVAFIWASAFGGYLLVRYVLEKSPDIKKPEQQ